MCALTVAAVPCSASDRPWNDFGLDVRNQLCDSLQDSTWIVDPSWSPIKNKVEANVFQFFTDIDSLNIALCGQSLIAVHECNEGPTHFIFLCGLHLQCFPCVGLGKRQWAAILEAEIYIEPGWINRCGGASKTTLFNRCDNITPCCMLIVSYPLYESPQTALIRCKSSEPILYPPA